MDKLTVDELVIEAQNIIENIIDNVCPKEPVVKFVTLTEAIQVAIAVIIENRFTVENSIKAIERVIKYTNEFIIPRGILIELGDGEARGLGGLVLVSIDKDGDTIDVKLSITFDPLVIEIKFK